jgi:hypothetical protein
LQRDSTISCQIIIYLNYEIKVFETLWCKSIVLIIWIFWKSGIK